jgi:UDP-glucose:(heptosyl)LPS alpha-1,3-glucosyltransferase
MKIALIRAKYDPFGGAERTINEAIDALIALGHQPTMVTRAWPDRATAKIDHRIVNPRYFTKAGRDRTFADAAHALLAHEPFDLVQSYERFDGAHIYHGVDGVHREWLAQRAKHQPFWERLGVALNPHHRHLLESERRMYQSPNLRGVICISEMVKREVIRHYDVSPDKLHVVYGPIDVEAFHPRLRAMHRDTIRRQYNIPDAAPIAIHVGSGFARKGVTMFLRAIAKVPGLHAFVVGRDKRSSAYFSLARSLGIADRVVFTGGMSDVKPFYGASDVFVMPTIYEPFGLVYGEAMACGLPVVASATSGAADWIEHGKSGFVVDAADLTGIVRAIEHAITETSASPTMGTLAREAVLRYGTSDTRTQYREVYARLGMA